MKATELLQKQHREIEQLLERLRTAGPEDAGRLREELGSLLVAHTKIEEEHFYPALREVAPDRVLEAVEEHGLAEFQLLRDLDARAGDEDARARTAVLSEVVIAHIRREENELFRRAENALSHQEMAVLGETMARRYEQVRRQSFRPMLVQSVTENLPGGVRLPARPARAARAALAASTRATTRRAPTKKATTRRGAAATTKRATTRKPTAKAKPGATTRGTQRSTSKRRARPAHEASPPRARAKRGHRAETTS